MKTIFLSAFLFLCLKSSGQYLIYVSFSDTAIINKHIRIDTTSSPPHQWQIGSAVKTVFNEPSPNKVIVTDTLNSYASNDTSVFILNVARPYPFGASNISTFLKFKYKLHKDIPDLFKVEVAADTAEHWVDMMTEDTTYQIVWYGNKPDFNDTSTQWKSFHANFSWWFKQYYGQANIPYYADADTFQFRFTFIADSLQSASKDGCMIDSIVFSFLLGENVDNTQLNETSIQFYPNPVKNILNICRAAKTEEEESVSIYTIEGRHINTYHVTGKYFIHLTLNSGVYMLCYKAGAKIIQQRILVQ